MDRLEGRSEVFDVETPWEYPDLATAVRANNSSGVAARAMAHSGEAAVTKAHEEVLASFRQSDGRICLGARFRALMATA